MNISSKPYCSYKPSAVPWIGKVPDQWQIARLKQCAQEINDQTAERKPGEDYIALENVEGWTGNVRNTGTEVQFESQVKAFKPDDILFGKLRPYPAKVTRPEYSGVCVGEFLVLRTSEEFIQPQFMERLLRSKLVIDTIDASTFGAKMPRANWQFIGNMEIPIPPLAQQATIVRYLDKADQQIQAYIGAKQKLIALLEEERQAVIHQAVTRGLDPNTKLKPSGVEWLEVWPESHWPGFALRQADVLQSYTA